MDADSSIAISIAQLLEIRHLPVPVIRNAPASNSAWVGSFTSRKRGHGTDYDDLRAYSAGDDIRHIDWRVSARMQELHTRLYHEEKDHHISIICDLRPCMFTGFKILRANQAILLAARCLWLACERGTRVNLLLVTPTGVSTMEPGSGHKTAISGCALLSAEHHRIASSLTETDRTQAIDDEQQHLHRHPLTVKHPSQGPSLDTLLQWITLRQEHRSTMLWFTALDFTGAHFLDSVSSLAPPSQSVFVYIDEPLLQQGLPIGDYHYESLLDADTAHPPFQRRTCINGANRRSLQEHLSQQWQVIVENLASLRLAYINTAIGNNDVIAALRYQAWLP